MNRLELNVTGSIPIDLDVKSAGRVIDRLNQAQPDWLQTGIINLKLVDDQQIRDLNKQYSGNDYATDVLSFSYIETSRVPRPAFLIARDAQPETSDVVREMLGAERELGDMVISLETAGRQAEVAGTNLADELATLALHGVLHIYGFDHAGEEERRIMDELQGQILTSANVTYRNFNWL